MRTGFIVGVLMLLGGCANTSAVLDELEQVAGQVLSESGELSINEISLGLKEALSVGSAQVVQQLGRTDGFNLDPVAHIPLPTALDRARKVAACLLYTSPSPRDKRQSRMPSSA